MPPPSADPRAAVARAIVAIERSCLDADAAFVERRWPDVDAALRAQAELTSELGDLFTAAPECAPANDERVARRVRGIVSYRNDQLRRMQAYHADVRDRLQNIGKVNALSRSLGKSGPRAQHVDGQY